MIKLNLAQTNVLIREYTHYNEFSNFKDAANMKFALDQDVKELQYFVKKLVNFEEFHAH